MYVYIYNVYIYNVYIYNVCMYVCMYVYIYITGDEPQFSWHRVGCVWFSQPPSDGLFFYEEYGGIFYELLWTANQRIPSGYD